jgi:hypothetical protein
LKQEYLARTGMGKGFAFFIRSISGKQAADCTRLTLSFVALTLS